MGTNPGATAYPDMGFNHGVGTDLNIIRKFCQGINNGG